MKKTAKVVVTWELDIPVDTEDETYKFDPKGMITQEVFDGLVRFAICKHAEEALHWLAKSKSNKKTTEHAIFRRHDFWANLLGKAELQTKIKYDVQLPK